MTDDNHNHDHDADTDAEPHHDGEPNVEYPDSSDDTRQEILDVIEDSDGAFVVGVSLVEGPDGEEGAGITVGRFVDDDLDDDDREAIKGAIVEATMEHAVPGGRGIPVPMEAVLGGDADENPLAALMGALGAESDEDEREDSSLAADDDPTYR